jgi:hypothetical protein
MRSGVTGASLHSPTRRSVIVSAALAVSLHAVPLLAQTSLEPRKLLREPRQLDVSGTCGGRASVTFAGPPIEHLNSGYHQGDWTSVQDAARCILDEAFASAGTDRPAYDYRSGHVWVTWVGGDAFGEVGVHRVLVHGQGRAPAPYKLDLPGVSTFFEIFLAGSPYAELTTTLVSTEKADETLAQIPAVAGRIVPALFGLLDATLPEAAVAPEPAPTERIWLTPFQIDLPARRAAIALTSVVGAPVSADAFATAANRLAVERGFQTSACARTLALAQGKAIGDARTSTSDCNPGGHRDRCLAAFDAALRKEFEAQTTRPRCATAAEGRAMAAVDDAFRDLALTGMAMDVKSDVRFANTPRQHVSFGLVEAVSFGVSIDDPRVDLDDGDIVADPLPRLLTLVTVNASFAGYDRTSVRPSEAEKWRWFGGVALVPDFGLAAGVSYLPVRGVSINLGYAWLFTKSAPAETIGRPPADAADAFDIGHARLWFAGVGYNFK